jgi:hypothetical protein
LEGRKKDNIIIVQSPESKIPGFRPAVWLDSVFTFGKINFMRAVSPRVKRNHMEAWKLKRTVLERGFTFVELWVAGAMDDGWAMGSRERILECFQNVQTSGPLLVLHTPYSVRSWLIGILARIEPVWIRNRLLSSTSQEYR